MRLRKGEDILDEKQNKDMVSVIAISWVICFIGMFIVYTLYDSGTFQGLIWFPLYVFINILAVSVGTLYLSRHS